jgi:hypothetical protein
MKLIFKDVKASLCNTCKHSIFTTANPQNAQEEYVSERGEGKGDVRREG